MREIHKREKVARKKWREEKPKSGLLYKVITMGQVGEKTKPSTDTRL